MVEPNFAVLLFGTPSRIRGVPASNFGPEPAIVTVILFRFSQENSRIVKVKQSRYRPGVAQRVPGSLCSQISYNGTGWW